MPAKSQVYVSALSELKSGESRIIEAAGKSIGVFNTGSRIVAALNLCPHEFAPVCRGTLSGTTPAQHARRIHLGAGKRNPALPLARLGIRPAHGSMV